MALGQVLPEWSPTTACDPALVGECAVSAGASALVEEVADLLTRGGVSGVPTRLGGGTTGGAWMGRDICIVPVGAEIGLGGPKWIAGSTPDQDIIQDIILHLVPWDETCFVPGNSLSEQAVIFNAHPDRIRAKRLAHGGLILYQLQGCVWKCLHPNSHESIPSFHPIGKAPNVPFA